MGIEEFDMPGGGKIIRLLSPEWKCDEVEETNG